MREDPSSNVFDFPNLGAASGRLVPGERSSEVTDLQQRLTRLGFVGLIVHGTYDEGTTEAVKYVQRALMRPDTGEVDSFIDASVSRAIEQSESMEAQKIAEAVKLWKKVAPGVSGLFAVSETLSNQIQIVEDIPLWKRPLFWLGVAAAGAGVYMLLRKPAEDGPPLFDPGEPPEGMDEPEDFFGEVEKPKKKRRKKKRALAAAPEVEVVDEVPEGAEEVEGEAHTDPAPPPEPEKLAGAEDKPKKRKPRKRRKKGLDGLTETAAAEPGVEHGEDVDTDEDGDEE